MLSDGSRARQRENAPVELRQLEYFVAVAEDLHFGRAAERLMIGQPAVSQQVSRLERELGVSLFNRTSRTVTLSDAGHRFLPAARDVLSAAERARAAAADRSGEEAAVLRVGSSTGLGDRLVGVLEAARRGTPPVQIRMVSAPTRARLERVRAGSLDAAFVRGVDSAPGLELIEVWHDDLVAVLPHSGDADPGRPVELPELAHLPLRLVSRSANQPLVDLVVAACATAGFTPVLEPGPHALQDTLAELASGSPGWTVIYAAHARQLRAPNLAFRPTDPPLALPTYLAVRADAGVSALAPLLRACAGEARTDRHP
jgi:DNA-binding transcriptional LysR family regulator